MGIKEKVNGSMPIWISVFAMIVSIIVGVTTILGNPFQAVTRSELRMEISKSELSIGERLGRMEGRLNKRIDELREDIKDGGGE